MNETQYIKQIRKGDQEALNAFIEELYPSVYRFIYRKMNGADIVNDITQEVFIRFIRVIPTYHSQGKILHYLYRISSNLCKDYWKKQKRESHLELEDELALDENTNVHENVINKLINESTLKMIQCLSQPQQDVILLKYYEQLTFKEIAQMYQVSESTIKSRHAQAILKLKKIAKEEERC